MVEVVGVVAGGMTAVVAKLVVVVGAMTVVVTVGSAAVVLHFSEGQSQAVESKTFYNKAIAKEKQSYVVVLGRKTL